MPRVPFVDPAQHPELAPLAARIAGARRGRLINVYRVLLHSPPLAESWLEHLNAVRWKTSISGRLREIVIVRIGHLLDVPYIIRQHVPKLAEAEGLSTAECEALADWRASPHFDAAERAVLAYADAITRDTRADDATFAALASHLAPAAIVELTVMIGTYNMHARVMNALQLDLEQE
jgi:4-carboxymuconolactone decarboxylase